MSATEDIMRCLLDAENAKTREEAFALREAAENGIAALEAEMLEANSEYLRRHVDAGDNMERALIAEAQLRDVRAYAVQATEALSDLLRQVETFVEQSGEADFYTAKAKAALAKNPSMPAHGSLPAPEGSSPSEVAGTHSEFETCKHPLTTHLVNTHFLTLASPPTEEQVNAWARRDEALIDLCGVLEERCEELAAEAATLRHQSCTQPDWLREGAELLRSATPSEMRPDGGGASMFQGDTQVAFTKHDDALSIWLWNNASRLLEGCVHQVNRQPPGPTYKQIMRLRALLNDAQRHVPPEDKEAINQALMETLNVYDMDDDSQSVAGKKP